MFLKELQPVESLKLSRVELGKEGAAERNVYALTTLPCLYLLTEGRGLEQRSEGKFGKGKPNGVALVFGFVSNNVNLS